MIGLIFDEGLVAVLISGAFLCNSVDEIDREGDMRQQIGVRDQ